MNHCRNCFYGLTIFQKQRGDFEIFPTHMSIHENEDVFWEEQREMNAKREIVI